MRSLLAVLLYWLARQLWPDHFPVTPGVLNEHDPAARRIIAHYRALAARRVEAASDLEDTQEMPAVRDCYDAEGVDTLNYDTGWQPVRRPVDWRDDE